MRIILIKGFVLIGFLILGTSNWAKSTKSRPNIIFILADDLGYSDVGFMEQKPEIETPNIDKLAKSGIIFTNAYAASPVCSPTRASILTGKYPATLHLTCHIPGIGMEEYIERKSKGQKLMGAAFIDHLPLNEITFAEVLQENGYNTAFIGKWHLAGEGSQKTLNGVVDASYHPDQQGFDINIGGCAYGQPADYFSPYRNATITDGPDNEYLTDRLGEEACKFIEKNKNERFLLYLSFYTVHTPWQVSDDVVKKYNGNRYYAMIDQLDENVGKILNKVSELDLTDSTLFVFSSDNGGTQENPPLRDRKGSLYEGGIRIPLIIKFPGVSQRGTICNAPVISNDFYPTFCEIAGIDTDTLQLDGLSLLPVIQNSKAELTREYLFWHYPHYYSTTTPVSAVRYREWKLIKYYEDNRVELYNLEDDIGEKKNLAKEIPDLTKKLLNKLDEWLQETDASFPSLNPTYSVK